MKYYSIGEVAAKFRLTESSIRYYEKKGLLPQIERDEAGRRIFSEQQLLLLETMIRLKNTQMSLSDIKQYIEWVVEGESTVERRLEMLVKHKQSVLDTISLMTESLDGIDYKISGYQKRIQERKGVNQL